MGQSDKKSYGAINHYLLMIRDNTQALLLRSN